MANIPFRKVRAGDAIVAAFPEWRFPPEIYPGQVLQIAGRPVKVVSLLPARTITVRELTRLERWLLLIAKRLDRWEGEMCRNGLYFVIGIREGSLKPAWSPSRMLQSLVER